LKAFVMLDLLMMCAPAVDPVTMAAVVKQESAGHPWVINNNTTKKSSNFRTRAEAVAAASSAIQQGDSVDMGLAQINSQNLPALGLSVDQVFDPCINLAAAAQILSAAYTKSGSLVGALSSYNTGRADSSRGFAYAQKIFAQAGSAVPAIPGGHVASLPKFDAKTSLTDHSADHPASKLPVRLTVTRTPFAAELSPATGALQPARWR
jgi:type IV secretion system protein VirB1